MIYEFIGGVVYFFKYMHHLLFRAMFCKDYFTDFWGFRKCDLWSPDCFGEYHDCSFEDCPKRGKVEE